MDAKVIGLGFQKTGTSSLREALKILGYKVLSYKKYIYPQEDALLFEVVKNKKNIIIKKK